MKKNIFFVIVLFVQIALYAQEYYPEGTKWTEIRLDTLKYDSWYSKVGEEWGPNFETVEYYVKGEYVEKIDDPFRFKCVYTSGPEWTDSLTLLILKRDYNGHKNCVLATVPVFYDNAYALFPGNIYQFDWSVGQMLIFQDIISSNATAIYPPGTFDFGKIQEIHERNFGGVRPLKCTEVNGVRIIQGIGVTTWNDGECLFGPVEPYRALSFFKEGFPRNERHYRSMLVHFERNGEVLYDVWPDKVSSLNIVHSTKPKQNGAIYDLSGRKVNSQSSYSLPTREGQGGSLQKGLYIVNGKKVVKM